MVFGLDVDQLENVHGKDAEFENIKKKKRKKKEYGAMLAGPETSFWAIDKPFNFFFRYK